MNKASEELSELVNKLDRYKQYVGNSTSDADIWYNELQVQKTQCQIKEKTKELLSLIK